MKIYTELIDLSNDIRQTFFVSPFSDYKMGVKVVQNVGFKVMDGEVELSPEAELIDGYTIYSLKSSEPGRKTYKVVCDNGQTMPIVEVTQKSTVYDVGSGATKMSQLENDSGFVVESEVQGLRTEITQATEIANTAQSNVDALQTNVQQNTTNIESLNSGIENVRSETEGLINELNTMLGDKADKTQLPTKTSQLQNDSGYTTQTYVDEQIGNVLTQETF